MEMGAGLDTLCINIIIGILFFSFFAQIRVLIGLKFFFICPSFLLFFYSGYYHFLQCCTTLPGSYPKIQSVFGKCCPSRPSIDQLMTGAGGLGIILIVLIRIRLP